MRNFPLLSLQLMSVDRLCFSFTRQSGAFEVNWICRRHFLREVLLNDVIRLNQELNLMNTGVCELKNMVSNKLSQVGRIRTDFPTCWMHFLLALMCYTSSYDGLTLCNLLITYVVLAHTALLITFSAPLKCIDRPIKHNITTFKRNIKRDVVFTAFCIIKPHVWSCLKP